MPYIITTLPEFQGDRANGAGFKQNVTRTAVATLDEARDVCWKALADVPRYGLQEAAINSAQVHDLTAEGGTVGPLPDGTVIEVQAVCWNWIIGMADDAGIDTDAVHEDGGDLAILAAYNGAHA